jgi:hypothetical protein
VLPRKGQGNRAIQRLSLAIDNGWRSPTERTFPGKAGVLEGTLIVNPTRLNSVIILITCKSCQPFTFSLPKTDMGPLSGDITSLHAHLSSNQTQFKNTAQLMRDVIAQEERCTDMGYCMTLSRRRNQSPISQLLLAPAYPLPPPSS